MRTILAATIVALIACPSEIQAGIILETTTMGPTSSSPNGNTISGQLLGARFTLTQSTTITAVGGHVWTSGSIWAAIVSLPGPSAVPTFAPASIQSNALASVTFNNVNPSQDARAALNTTLGAGSYALVFGGANLFGTSGIGSMQQHVSQTPINASIFWSNLSTPGWNDFTIPQLRFVVEGEPIAEVPEPASIVLLGLGLTGLGCVHARSRRQTRSLTA